MPPLKRETKEGSAGQQLFWSVDATGTVYRTRYRNDNHMVRYLRDLCDRAKAGLMTPAEVFADVEHQPADLQNMMRLETMDHWRERTSLADWQGLDTSNSAQGCVKASASHGFLWFSDPRAWRDLVAKAAASSRPVFPQGEF